MKKSFLKKLAAYSGASVTSIASAFNSNAQTICTDVTDTSINHVHPFFPLDLNNDGAFDYALYFTNVEGIRIVGINNSYCSCGPNLIAESDVWGYSIAKFSESDTINENLDWELPGTYEKLLAWSSPFSFAGNWCCGTTDRYCGLKFLINNEYHFGWARLDVAPHAGTVTLKEYAYEAAPNTPVIAGQCDFATSIPYLVTDQNFGMSIFPNPFTESASIEFSLSHPDIILIELIETSGRRIKTIAEGNFEAGNHQLNFQSDNLDAGIYLIQLKSKSGMATEKVVIE